MTFRNDEIQKLIADIDNLLNSNSTRLSRLLSSQAQEPKEVLERTRNFLIQLQEPEKLEHSQQNLSGGQSQKSSLLEKFIDQGQNQATSPQISTHQESTQELTHSLTEQIKNELSACIQPLQGEITALLQERTVLAQEIRQLEQRRLHNYSLSQQLANQEQIITEFLQVLMSRLAPALMPKMAEARVNYSSDVNNNHHSNLEATDASSQPFWESSEKTERLTQLAQELDQRLLSLDGTVNVVFDSLQRNVNTYHESLSQSLVRMHSKGLQGEQLLVSLLDNLTQHIQQNLSNSSVPTPKLENQTLAATLSSVSPVIPDLSPSTDTSLSVESELLFTDNTNEESRIFAADLDVTMSNGVLSTEDDHLLETAEFEALMTDELDEMLLQLGVDESISAENLTTPDILSEDSGESTDDEVDLIYASLFGNDNYFINALLELNSETVTEELPGLDAADTVIAPQNILAEVDTAAMMPEAWFDESDTDFFNDTNPLDIPDPPIESTDLLLFAEPTPTISFVDAVDLPAIQPTHEDTITSLTDLFADVDIEELARSWKLEETAPPPTVSTPEPVILEQLAVASAVEDEAALIVPTVEQKPPRLTHKQPEHSPEQFIPASPQENLLSPEVTELANLPEIALNEEQWLKLHQDLAKLDEPNSQTPQSPLMGLESAEFWVSDGLRDREQLDQEVAENTLTVDSSPLDVSPANPISTPQTETALDFSPTEKEQEVPTTTYDSSVIIPDNPIDNTEIADDALDSVWYLGIDLGTTGISATLLNRSTGVVYPICWSAEQQPGTNNFQQSFRLPAEVYLPNTSLPPRQADSSDERASHLKNHLYSAQLKPYLQVAIPYKNEEQKWQPVLQFNEFSAGPLIWIVRSLSKLLLTLKADRDSTTQGLIATAVGLDESTFHSIIDQIAGVICNSPSSWSEQYRFNLREALLTSRLVQHPQQVFFVEEAIASLLSILNGANGETVKFSTHEGLTPAQTSDYAIVGNTLVINIGATATEMGLVDVPDRLEQLTHNHFMLHGFAYASKGIEQDIICQLLLPPKYRQSRGENPEDNQKIHSHPWQWQSAFPDLDEAQWESLGLDDLELPRVGEPDIKARILLQQRLESSLLGQAVLDAALALKLILQRQESFSFELADQRWILQRRDLETQVFVPFVRRLNRELNKLLVARGIPTEAINQAILSGGVANLGVVNRWLRQKLPNAKMIQDAYLGENGIPNCSRVAYGLAVLPLHPQVLEESRHQYTDYFLFTELLRLLPDRTLAFGEVLHLFEARGINTSTCQQRLLAFLEGELPPGLIPVSPESTWLTQNSQSNSDYQAIASTPLFEKQGNLTYRPNFSQLQIFHRYLNAMKASTQQSLDEPYTINFRGVGV
ncbi:hypothetical protein [Nostoc sp. UHCC 0870]|uniref:hypothetical protein n=1 Tax=Nostoc sp. UHCC 0870 TaxID=2914041 RepID=UPI001EE14562|nr:hypothetical protein [Nostoc sp. UHCC 0870]UKO97126.1 hypothetical protein L6494_21415 [Nostoc sp. UHCC 0870]